MLQREEGPTANSVGPDHSDLDREAQMMAQKVVEDPQKLEDQAWQLIEVAKRSPVAVSRQALMKQAFELLKQGQKLREHANADAEIEPAETHYRLWLEADDGSVSISLKIECMADAFWAAEALAAACAERYTSFELWRGWRIIYGGSTRNCSFTVNPTLALTRATQAEVLEKEELLQASRIAVARGKRMLAMTEQLRQKLVQSDLDVFSREELNEEAALQPKRRNRSG
jgi:hypothetical protein